MRQIEIQTIRYQRKDWGKCVIVSGQLLTLLTFPRYLYSMVSSLLLPVEETTVVGSTVRQPYISRKGVAVFIRNNLTMRKTTRRARYEDRRSRGVALIIAKDIEPLIAEQALERGRAQESLTFASGEEFCSFVRAFRPASFMSPQVGAHTSGRRNVLSSSDQREGASTNASFFLREHRVKRQRRVILSSHVSLQRYLDAVTKEGKAITRSLIFIKRCKCSRV